MCLRPEDWICGLYLALGGSAPVCHRYRASRADPHLSRGRMSIWLRQALGGACSSSWGSMGCRSGARSTQVECKAAHGGAHGCAHVLARAHPRARQALRRRLSSTPRPVRGPLNEGTVTSPVTDFWNRRRKNAAIRKKGGRKQKRASAGSFYGAVINGRFCVDQLTLTLC